MEEKIKLCATCKNRKYTLQRGVVCKLTDEKPDFSDSCESYNVDQEAIIRKESEKIVDDLLDGSVWFKIIAYMMIPGLLLMTLLRLELLQYSLFSTTEVVLITCADVLVVAFYFLTWYFSARKGYKLCYNIGAGILLLDVIYEVYISIQTFSFWGMFEKIWYSILLCFLVFVLTFGLKLYRINFVQKKSEAFTNLPLKISYILLALIVVSRYIYSFFLW